MTTRRKIIIAMGAGALAPVASFAQAPGKIWRIGFLAQRHVELNNADFIYGPFTQGLRELGYVTGKNLLIEWRSAEGKDERLPELAAELVRLKIDVLVTAGTPPALAAQKATATIPIVAINMADPTGSGLVKSLARPGGNITGFSNLVADIAPKLLELLHAMTRQVTRVAVLVNPSDVSTVLGMKNILAAAKQVGVTVQPVEARTPQEIENAFAVMARQKTGALIVTRNPLFQQQKNQIVELAAKHRLPSIGGYGEYVEAGGLMSYGNNIGENYRRAPVYVDKIFKGANPGELPVQQPTTFDLAVNMKTAKTLGLKVPQSILILATKVIE